MIIDYIKKLRVNKNRRVLALILRQNKLKHKGKDHNYKKDEIESVDARIDWIYPRVKVTLKILDIVNNHSLRGKMK